MRDGWTMTVERLTWDGREPDAYDWRDEDENINPSPRWVVRQYDVIVRSRPIDTVTPENLSAYTQARERFMHELASTGIIVDPEVDWRDYTLLAESLHARYVRAQTETLPLAV